MPELKNRKKVKESSDLMRRRKGDTRRDGAGETGKMKKERGFCRKTGSAAFISGPAVC